ncbi:MAG: nickel pincer cofactor biosynthesis protein LarC [Planctomycetota bacterium]
MIAYFDTFSGASGDMIVGALLDAGLSIDDLRAELAKLALRGYRIGCGAVKKCGLSATKFEVSIERDAGHPHRTLANVTALLDESVLSDAVRENARRVFRRLAEAEAAVHGVPVEDIHFHEVGAVDSIVDIVGAAIGIERLGITQIVSGPLRFGSGTIKCAHGTLPVPAPATARLAEGFPVEYTGIEGELTTPTGAAILTALAGSFGPPPPMTLEKTGVGAGSADRGERPNVLRVLIGKEDDTAADVVVILEANIDDASGEIIGYASEALLAAGALDVFAVPIQMKKSRPGVLLSVIAKPADRTRLEEIIFRETTTLGIRRREEVRTKLARRFVEAEVFGEKVTVKLGLLGGAVINISPEYESCARVARKKNIPLREVYDVARESVTGDH